MPLSVEIRLECDRCGLHAMHTPDVNLSLTDSLALKNVARNAGWAVHANGQELLCKRCKGQLTAGNRSENK